MKVIAGPLIGHEFDTVGTPGSRSATPHWQRYCPRDTDGDGNCNLCAGSGLHICTAEIGPASPCYDVCFGVMRGRTVLRYPELEFDDAAEARAYKAYLASGRNIASELDAYYQIGEDRRFWKREETP